MKISLKQLIVLGVLAEILIFLCCYFMNTSLEETFRYAARYSGRLSAIVFLTSFYLFASSRPTPVLQHGRLQDVIVLFAVLHAIHFGFLITNVYLNAIPLEGVKLAGGALAYGMILLAPFFLHRIKFKFQLVYFYYVSFVMIMTYLARVQGDFQGANPDGLHYGMLSVFIICSLLFAVWMVRSTLLGRETTS